MTIIKQWWFLPLMATILAILSIALNLQTFERSMKMCVTRQDAQISGGHYLTYQGGIIPTTFMIPESVIDYYRSKVVCVANDKFVSKETASHERVELESLRLVESVERNKKGKLCALLSNNRKVCER